MSVQGLTEANKILKEGKDLQSVIEFRIMVIEVAAVEVGTYINVSFNISPSRDYVQTEIIIGLLPNTDTGKDDFYTINWSSWNSGQTATPPRERKYFHALMVTIEVLKSI